MSLCGFCFSFNMNFNHTVVSKSYMTRWADNSLKLENSDSGVVLTDIEIDVVCEHLFKQSLTACLD